MKTRFIAAATLAAGLGLSSAASATVVLFDDFNSEAPDQLNWDGNAFFFSSSAPGSVDLIGAGGGWDLFAGQGSYVDLDGSTGSGNDPAGELTSFQTFAAGSYSISFKLAGNQRGAPARVTRISLGDWSTDIELSSSDPLSTYTFDFTTSGGQLVFTQLGPSNQMGNILDDVSLTSLAVVPEPATWAMMILGFGSAGAMLRRKALATA